METTSTTGADGSVTGTTREATEGGFDFPAGEFSLLHVVVPAEAEESTLLYIDQVDVGECEPDTQSGGTTPTPAPTTPAPAPDAAAPVVPVAAPIVVTHPATAQPAVLAVTGASVTAAALLGGGLLVAGAGALVATRRRAS